MKVACERCSKEGSVEEQSYRWKKVTLRCPYCSHAFINLVPLTADIKYAAKKESENSLLAVPQTLGADEAAIREAKRTVDYFRDQAV
jgi:hypothetical protein